MIPAPIVCFGEALWDVTPRGRLVGGAPLNVALRLVGFGVDTIMLSRVGNDSLGDDLLKFLSASELDASHVQVDADQPTGVVLVDDSNPDAVKYEIAAPAAWDYIDAQAFLSASNTQPGPIVYGSLAARSEMSRVSLLRLLEQSPLRIFDVNLRPPFYSRATVEKLLERADWLKLNESELAIIAGWLDATGSQNKMTASICAHYGIDTACVTLGAAGALMYHHGEIFTQAAYTVPVVDTIGCGDAFLAGWLARMLDDAPAREVLKHACAAGALAATAAGGNAPVSAAMIESVISDD